MSRGPGHTDGPNPRGPEDASYWWLDNEALSSSRPSETRLRLERLRHDVHSAPDLSARILGKAGAKDVFVPRGRRRAIRAMRWGGAAAAAVLLGVTLWTIHRTPAGNAVLANQPTPVSDIVSDFQGDAERFATNVRELPSRLVASNRVPARAVASSAPLQPVSPTEPNTLVRVASFSTTVPERFASNTSFIVRPFVDEGLAPAAPLGAGYMEDAFEAIASAIQAAERLRPSQASIRVQTERLNRVGEFEAQSPQAGFFAGEPDPR